MKIGSAIILFFLICGFAQAQLNLYTVQQLGTGKWTPEGKVSKITWAASNAKLSIDLDNRSIYIYDKGVTQHINLIKETNKGKSSPSAPTRYSAVDDNRLTLDIAVTNRNNPSRLSVFTPDGLVAIYKIKKENLKQ